jgi:cyclic pyranopterin phosphate synthase
VRAYVPPTHAAWPFAQAGTTAVKQTSSLIPFCHQLLVEGCRVVIRPANKEDALTQSGVSSSTATHPLVVECEVKVTGKTGAEMEALVGANIAALTIYDMCKAVSSDMVVGPTRLLHKST